MSSKRQLRKRGQLKLKMVVGLLVLSLLPLLVSSFLIGNIGEVAQNFASNHVARLRPHLQNAQGAYRELIATKRALFQQRAKALAQREDLLSQIEPLVKEFRAQSIEVRSAAGERLAYAEAARVASMDSVRYRAFPIREKIAGGDGKTVVVVFAADQQPVEKLQALGEALAVSKQVDVVRSSLPSSYRTAFLLLVGGVVVIVTLLALLFARGLTRRMDVLVAGARGVAKGNLDTRVTLTGADEFGELAVAFNTMVDDLQEERKKTLYLQRIGAWQDVARKLAHEIKNPLTPIQLVVQQVVSKYDGDDEKYRTLLKTCDEIVHEEVNGLRRLVDAFRDLGRLPKVEAKSLALATLLEDIQSDPTLSSFVQTDGDAGSCSLKADRLLLRRTLVNVLENGIHAGQEAGREGRVLLSWKCSEGSVVFQIDDEGAGVAKERREQIFDPYETSKETGTGLGLAIAKKIALDHQGDLRLSSERSAMGGARFVLRIPLVEDGQVSGHRSES